MALIKEVWMADIQETLDLNADFIGRMRNLDEFITNGYIHVPQASALTAPVMNNTTFPLPVQHRTDSELLIKVDQFQSPVYTVPDIESFQISYNKRESIMGGLNRELVAYIGDQVFQRITPTAANRKVTSTGALKYSDILAVAKKLDLDNVPKSDRHLELPTDLFYELLLDDDVKNQYISGFATVASGAEAGALKLAGIMIHERPTVATVGGAQAGVAYHKDAVGVGRGGVGVLTGTEGDPVYGGGTTMSSIVWLGAGVLRSDNKGIVTLVRGA
jgi:hypothetical protein